MKYLLLIISVISGLSLLSPVNAATIRGGSSGKAVEAELKRRSRLVPRVSSETLKKVDDDALRKAAIKAGPLKPSIDQSHRSNFPDPKKVPTPKRPGAYPWHYDITATYFYIGELPTKNNPTPNTASSWDSAWDDNYGGFDDPNPANRCPRTYCPKGFIPKLNPFYVALPYNDIQKGGPKPEAARVIPWYRRDKEGKYESVCRGMWVQIYYNGKYCFAQWEDCGPFVTDDWQYVFGGSRPKNEKNNAAGIDISPAVRDYLGIPGGMAKVHWRFVDFHLVPGGPWAKIGKDNPFVNPALRKAIQKYELKQRNIHALNKGKYSSR
ncbi:MAG: hypothetical protein IKL98_07405 [Akkermansia sp.]|nr:hypothetical protein [Akkermansia sp.]